MIDDIPQHLPALLVQIKLEEVIETAIACNLQLGAHAKASTFLLGNDNGLDDALFVACEVERPLTVGLCELTQALG